MLHWVRTTINRWRHRQNPELTAYLHALEAMKVTAVSSAEALEASADVMKQMLDMLRVTGQPTAQVDPSETWVQQQEDKLTAKGITVDERAKRRLQFLAENLDD